MRLFGFNVNRAAKPIPAPIKTCSCDSFLHLTRMASLARDVAFTLFLWENYQRMLAH